MGEHRDLPFVCAAAAQRSRNAAVPPRGAASAFGASNFDFGQHAVGGLTTIAGDDALFAWIASQDGNDALAWRAITNGTGPMRDSM